MRHRSVLTEARFQADVDAQNSRDVMGAEMTLGSSLFFSGQHFDSRRADVHRNLYDGMKVVGGCRRVA